MIFVFNNNCDNKNRIETTIVVTNQNNFPPKFYSNFRYYIHLNIKFRQKISVNYEVKSAKNRKNSTKITFTIPPSGGNIHIFNCELMSTNKNMYITLG